LKGLTQETVARVISIGGHVARDEDDGEGGMYLLQGMAQCNTIDAAWHSHVSDRQIERMACRN
jgi:hypothetical protein